MAVAGSLTYDTKLDTKGFDKGIKSLSTVGVAFGNLMADAFKGIAKAMGDVVKQGITYNAQIEQYQVALTTLTGSAEEAQRIMENIKEDAAKTPFDVAGLTSANQLLISAGVSADDARKDIKNLGNAISATGGGNEELSRMAVNLQQIKNVGKASALDIKQFAYAGIDIYGLLADSMGITREEAVNTEVTYEALTEALQYASEEGGKYFGAMEEQSKTLNGQISTLKDNLMTFFGEAAEPLFNFLKDEALPIINDFLSGNISLEDGILQLFDTILDGLMNALQVMIEKLPEVLEIGIKIIVSLIQGLTEKIPELIPTMVDAIILIVETLIDNLDLIIDAGIELILALVEGIIEAIPRLIEKAPEIIEKMYNAFVRNFPKIVKAGGELIGKLIMGIVGSMFKLVEVAPKLISNIVNGLRNGWNEIKNVGKYLIEGLWEGIRNMKGWLLNKIKSWCGSVLNGFKSFFGIHSPSRVMRDQIGQWIPKGVAVGIDANTDSALKSIDLMNDEIMDKMNKAVVQEKAVASFGGMNSSVSEILNANSIIKVENYNTLELDGEKVYENQKNITKNKNLQYGFGGAY